MQSHHVHAMPSVGSGVVDPWSWSWVAAWLLMVVAMMWPLAIPTVGRVTRSSFRGWRTRLGLVTIATITLLWLAAGLAGATLARGLAVTPGNVAWQIACVCVGLAAFASARRSRLLAKCSRLPAIAPGGRRGVFTAARAGALTWRRCAVLCGPVMLAMTVGHSPAVMVSGSLAAWWEAWHPRAWRDPVPALLIAGGGVWLVTTALLGGGVDHG